ncbi:uncharacterized protein VTP21DRAFT_8831 [Calcarisporiella thermophila]|uniref:uncharacterized protein n=1 Tax=Calcarisporiella thermophila TaxID=911321 RepID=UPI003743E827
MLSRNISSTYNNIRLVSRPFLVSRSFFNSTQCNAESNRGFIDARREYKEKMSALRTKYAKEVHKQNVEKQLMQESKRIKEQERAQQLRQERKKELEREIIAEQRLQDELEKRAELENVIAHRHTAKAEKMETIDQRAQLRAANRRSRLERLSQHRLNQLMKLYHNTEEFVTPSNLEEKLDAFMRSPRVPFRETLDDMISQQQGAAQRDKLVRSRMEQLREVLDGTVMGGKLGVDGIIDWQVKEDEKESSKRADNH